MSLKKRVKTQKKSQGSITFSRVGRVTVNKHFSFDLTAICSTVRDPPRPRLIIRRCLGDVAHIRVEGDMFQKPEMLGVQAEVFEHLSVS